MPCKAATAGYHQRGHRRIRQADQQFLSTQRDRVEGYRGHPESTRVDSPILPPDDDTQLPKFCWAPMSPLSRGPTRVAEAPGLRQKMRPSSVGRVIVLHG